MARFAQKYLETSEIMSELVFGLIMTLTFTLGASLVIQEGPDATKELLVGVIGCNIAWGIIDGLLYVFNSMYERGATFRAASFLRKHGRAATETLVRRHLDETYDGRLSDATKSAVTADLLPAIESFSGNRVKATRDDLMGALASFWLVVATSIPAVAPFLLIDDRLVAIRVSNLLLVALLYVIGRIWAASINANPNRIGLGMALLGLVLVQVTIWLGG